MAQVKLFGYTDKISVKPGEVVQFHVNAEGTDTAQAQLVRLIHGDQDPAGPGFIEEEIACAANGAWKVEEQYAQLGLFLEVTDPERKLALAGSVTLLAFICPNLVRVAGGQCVIGRWDNYRKQGYCIAIAENARLEFRIGQEGQIESLQVETPLRAGMWYFVAATLNAKTGRAILHQEAIVRRYNALLGPVALFDHLSQVSKIFHVRPSRLVETPFLLAGARDWSERRGAFVAQLFCGKIDRPALFDRSL